MKKETEKKIRALRKILKMELENLNSNADELYQIAKDLSSMTLNGKITFDEAINLYKIAECLSDEHYNKEDDKDSFLGIYRHIRNKQADSSTNLKDLVRIVSTIKTNCDKYKDIMSILDKIKEGILKDVSCRIKKGVLEFKLYINDEILVSAEIFQMIGLLTMSEDCWENDKEKIDNMELVFAIIRSLRKN